MHSSSVKGPSYMNEAYPSPNCHSPKQYAQGQWCDGGDEIQNRCLHRHANSMGMSCCYWVSRGGTCYSCHTHIEGLLGSHALHRTMSTFSGTVLHS